MSPYYYVINILRINSPRYECAVEDACFTHVKLACKPNKITLSCYRRETPLCVHHQLDRLAPQGLQSLIMLALDTTAIP
jgi:hypothetical protein